MSSIARSLIFFLVHAFFSFSKSAVGSLGRVKRQNEILAKDVFSEEGHLPLFLSVENVTVSFGSKAVLKCEVENLKNYKVAWIYRDRQSILTISKHVITRNPRISISRPEENKWYLHIDSVRDTDRGWYLCQINTDPMMYRSGYLEVLVPPKIIKELTSSSNLVVREGDNVTLTCKATGYPSPHIMWRREDGDAIITQSKKVINIEKEILVLERVSRLNMGDYLCVASNGVSPTASNRFSIRVQFPPKIFVPSQLQAVSIGQDITIECHTEAYPKSINYWVNSKGAMIISNEKYEAVSVDSDYKIFMKLRIMNVTKNDIMDYRCIAKNSLGQSDGSITLNEVLALTTIPGNEDEDIDYDENVESKQDDMEISRSRQKEQGQQKEGMDENSGPEMSKSHEKSLQSIHNSSTNSCFSIFCFLFVPNKRSIEYYYFGE